MPDEDEVDAFHSGKDRVMLNENGDNASDSDGGIDEEAVMDLNAFQESSDEDSGSDSGGSDDDVTAKGGKQPPAARAAEDDSDDDPIAR